MNKHPLSVFHENDPALTDVFNRAEALAFADGALSAKQKTLIALAIDAALGAAEGVHSLSARAKQMGATREEILEVMHVVYLICGIGKMYTAAQGLDGVL
jgi:alkylhydroperoxidase/carboxymuconolactone decarboxylase family protein YurZ